MATIGEQFKAAREKKGVTPSQAAAATRMKVQHIESMERSDFSRMAAPAYAKGFIRLYAEYLNIPADPLIALYLEQHADQMRPMLTGEPPKPVRKKPHFRVRAPKKAPTKDTSQKAAPEPPPPRERKPMPSLSERFAPVTALVKALWNRLSSLSRERVIPVLSGAAAIVLLFLLVFGVSHCSRGWEQRKAQEAARKDTELPAGLIREPPAPYIDTEHLAPSAPLRRDDDTP